jgi:hypothetical protein
MLRIRIEPDARKLRWVVAALALYPGLALSQAEAPRRTGCSAAGARFAIGEAFTTDLAERAREAARARAVRKIERGGAYTMDFSPDRLNIEVDSAGIVRDLTCG